ncbi:hypothetical protein CC2G_010317 [Coprinopsis cinerea AmutBmut pab1-1]|nr:hypothetical protein CC2G_010317 [Coprinopsis cinerea AmutBmut pab1-1]
MCGIKGVLCTHRGIPDSKSSGVLLSGNRMQSSGHELAVWALERSGKMESARERLPLTAFAASGIHEEPTAACVKADNVFSDPLFVFE